MDAWVIVIVIAGIFAGVPTFAYLVGKYAQVGKLSGIRSFVKHSKGERDEGNDTPRQL